MEQSTQRGRSGRGSKAGIKPTLARQGPGRKPEVNQGWCVRRGGGNASWHSAATRHQAGHGSRPWLWVFFGGVMGHGVREQ